MPKSTSESQAHQTYLLTYGPGARTRQAARFSMTCTFCMSSNQKRQNSELKAFPATGENNPLASYFPDPPPEFWWKEQCSHYAGFFTPALLMPTPSQTAKQYFHTSFTAFNQQCQRHSTPKNNRKYTETVNLSRWAFFYRSKSRLDHDTNTELLWKITAGFNGQDACSLCRLSNARAKKSKWQSSIKEPYTADSTDKCGYVY